jgi:hypothetical protein
MHICVYVQLYVHWSIDVTAPYNLDAIVLWMPPLPVVCPPRQWHGECRLCAPTQAAVEECLKRILDWDEGRLFMMSMRGYHTLLVHMDWVTLRCAWVM